jgi:hypothetical protein
MGKISISLNAPRKERTTIIIDGKKHEVRGNGQLDVEVCKGNHLVEIMQQSILDSPLWLLKPFQMLEITNGIFLTFVSEVGFDGDCAYLSFRVKVKEAVTLNLRLNKVLFNQFGPYISRYYHYCIDSGSAKCFDMNERLNPSKLYLNRWHFSRIAPRILLFSLFLVIAIVASVLAVNDLKIEEWLFIWGGICVFLGELIYHLRKIKHISNRVDEMRKY